MDSVTLSPDSSAGAVTAGIEHTVRNLHGLAVARTVAVTLSPAYAFAASAVATGIVASGRRGDA
jgi:fatty acid/phospholipid biosynthesis enzyme